MKATWLSAHGGGRVKFMSTKKYSADGKDMNMLVVSTVYKALDTKKKSKTKSKNNSNLYNQLEQFNTKNMDIIAESNSDREHGHEKASI